MGLALFMIDGDQEQPLRRLEKRSGIVAAPRLAATNNCLAQRNKTRTRPKATNKRLAARRNFVRRQPARPRCGVSAAGLSPPFGGAKSR